MLPPWKQALIEKRRRQEEEDRKRFDDEQAKLSVMPVWKREILKKRQQKNSLVFLAKRSPGGGCDVNGVNVKRQDFTEGVVAVEAFHVTEEDLDNPEELLTKVVLNHKRPEEDQVSLQGPIEEHVKPVQENPWLVTDTLRKKKQKPSPRSSSGGSGSGGNYRPVGGPNHVICERETDGRLVYDQQFTEDIITNDSVFTEDLPEYGRGFVHKLRSRFATLSDKDKRASSGERQRSQSSDSLLEDSLKVSPRGGATLNDGYVLQSSLYGSQKAHSMESLLGEPPAPVGSPRRKAQERAVHDEVLQYGGERRNSLEMPPLENTQDVDDPEVLPRPNTVSAARSIFETPSPQKRDKISDKSLESPRAADYNEYQSEKSSDYRPDHRLMQNGSGSYHAVKGNGSASNTSEETLRSIRDVGKVVYSTDGEMMMMESSLSPRSPSQHVHQHAQQQQQPSQGDNVNDRNANYTREVLESGEAASSAAVTTTQRHSSLSSSYNNRSGHTTPGSGGHGGSGQGSLSQGSLSSSSSYSRSVFNNDVAQRNQNNNLLSAQRHVNGATPEVISTNPDSTSPLSPRGTSSSSSYHSKKRPAPLPPQFTSPEDSKKHAGSDETSKNNLTLDLKNAPKDVPQIFDESPSYRDLYFAGRKKEISPRNESYETSPSASSPRDSAQTNSSPVEASRQQGYSISSSYSNTGFQPTVQTKNRTAFTAEPSRKLSPADDSPHGPHGHVGGSYGSGSHTHAGSHGGYSARSVGVKYDAIRNVQGNTPNAHQPAHGAQSHQSSAQSHQSHQSNVASVTSVNDITDAASETSSVSSASHDTNLSNGWSSSSVTSVTSVDSPKREPIRSSSTNVSSSNVHRHSYHEETKYGGKSEVSDHSEVHRRSDNKPEPSGASTGSSVSTSISRQSQQTQEKSSVSSSVTPRQGSLDSNKPQVTMRQSPPSHDVTKRYTFPQSTTKESSSKKKKVPTATLR